MALLLAYLGVMESIERLYQDIILHSMGPSGGLYQVTTNITHVEEMEEEEEEERDVEGIEERKE